MLCLDWRLLAQKFAGPKKKLRHAPEDVCQRPYQIFSPGEDRNADTSHIHCNFRLPFCPSAWHKTRSKVIGRKPRYEVAQDAHVRGADSL